MFDLPESVDSVAHVIQVALTPVFLLSGIAALLGVFSARLARVADRVDALSEMLDRAPAAKRGRLQRRLAYLQRRSHALDTAVILGAIGGGATCLAALLLFVGTLRDQTGATFLFASFGLALLCTAGALAAFLVEVLLASHGLRDRVSAASDGMEPGEFPEEQHGEGDESEAPDGSQTQ